MASLWRDYGVTITVAVVAAFAIRSSGIEAYRIPTSSMHPTLEPGDTIFVAKWKFGFHLPGSERKLTLGQGPSYGEVVIYNQPGDPPRDSIKRIIALPGDRVFSKGGRLFLNGKELSEGIPRDQSCGREKLPGENAYTVCWEAPLMEDFEEKKIEPGQVLLASDLRMSPGTDTKKIPPIAVVPLSNLKGQALWVWLSIKPSESSTPHSVFARIRFERMFQRIL